jgi:hypothetical protein
MRLLKHAHRCRRCGKLYERWALANRVLEHGSFDQPAEMELAVLEAAGLEAALSAAEKSTLRPAWISWATVAGFVATAAAAAFLLVRPPQGEWTARGNASAPHAVFRVFCSQKGEAIRELRSDQACPRGASLAFAVGAEPPLSYAALTFHSSKRTIFEGPFAIPGKPGAEAPLGTTIPLDFPAGEAEVIAAFAREPAAAEAAAKEGAQKKGVVVFRQKLRVGEAR